jgi:flagellar biosynthesis anti-sigma factor FlgM
MKISSEESLRAGRIEPITPTPSGAAKTPAAAPGSSPAAHVELSAQAQALAAAKTEATHYIPAVQAAPETRDDLVSQLKARVESGSYHVSGADIADQLVRRVQADRVR